MGRHFRFALNASCRETVLLAKRFLTLACFCVATLANFGCMTSHELRVPLAGTWLSNAVETEWGIMQFKCVFYSNSAGVIHFQLVSNSHASENHFWIQDDGVIVAPLEKARDLYFHPVGNRLHLTLTGYSDEKGMMIEHTWVFKRIGPKEDMSDIVLGGFERRPTREELMGEDICSGDGVKSRFSPTEDGKK